MNVKNDKFAVVDSQFGVRTENRKDFINWYGELSTKYNLTDINGVFEATLNRLSDRMTVYGACGSIFSGQIDSDLNININESFNVFCCRHI